MCNSYENGKTPLGLDFIVTICNFFHCSTYYLYFGREKEIVNGNDMIQKITMILPNTPEEGVKVVLDMLLVLGDDLAIDNTYLELEILQKSENRKVCFSSIMKHFMLY